VILAKAIQQGPAPAVQPVWSGSEGSQVCYTAKYGHEYCGTRNQVSVASSNLAVDQSVGWSSVALLAANT
jgi:hypothetical protein